MNHDTSAKGPNFMDDTEGHCDMGPEMGSMSMATNELGTTDVGHSAPTIKEVAEPQEAPQRMDNDHVPLPAPTAHHFLGESQNKAEVPRRFSDFSKTPDLFRHTPVD